MADNQFFAQKQSQSQRQVQRMSQRQIQAVNYLGMSVTDLREEILKTVYENPALEIVGDTDKSQNSILAKKDTFQAADDFQNILEQSENHKETLQQHLVDQLNMMNLSADEQNLCYALIYNLDKNGFYGNMLAPETLLDKNRPVQNQFMLTKCINLIQNMDPIGVCCKDVTESLYVQAKIHGDAPKLALFFLDGHLEMLDPPIAKKIYSKVTAYKNEWNGKKFATQTVLDRIQITEEEIQKSLDYILKLNLHPASEYDYDISSAHFNQPDIVLNIEKKDGALKKDDFVNGLVCGDDKVHFEVKYASGGLPQVRIKTGFEIDKAALEKAKAFLENLMFRQNTIVVQGCQIVSSQKDFFINGPGHLVPLTRRSLAKMLGIHESTVSRVSAKRNSKYFDTEWGLLPASYFFTSSVATASGEKMSSSVIKDKIIQILKINPELSDSKLCDKLNSDGIKIARRTVAKYRSQIGIRNSFDRG